MAATANEGAARKAPKKENVVRYADLVQQLSERHKLPAVKVGKVIQGLVELAAEGLKRGHDVQIAGLGVLRVKDLPVREEVGGKPRPARKVVLGAGKKFTGAVGL